MVLAESGFGKTTSIGENKALGLKGLDASKTFLVQSTKKGLPFPKNKTLYQPLKRNQNKELEGNLLYSNDPEKVIAAIRAVLKAMPHIETFVFDDFNFYMQDYYMQESRNKKDNFKIFQAVGGQTSGFFDIFDVLADLGKNVIVLAHPEIYKNVDGVERYKFKTVGNMVDKYITPEGRFEIVLMGKVSYNPESKKIEKVFVTNDDGQYNAKSPFGMFEDIYIPNDLGLVIDKINEYNN